MRLLSEITIRPLAGAAGVRAGAAGLAGAAGAGAAGVGGAADAGGAAIQLLQGDITAIPKEHHVDILVVSAFPGDYTPLPGSLMYALHEKGVEVGEFAEDKAVDLVQQLGCWLSKPLSSAQQEQFNFSQILCFEPSRESGSPETVVGNIFRCINNFVFDTGNNVIAMPVLASGRQKVPVEKMLPAMLDACIFWMESGIPIHYIKLIIHSDEHCADALTIFERIRQEYEAGATLLGPSAPASFAPAPPSYAPAPPFYAPAPPFYAPPPAPAPSAPSFASPPAPAAPSAAPPVSGSPGAGSGIAGKKAGPSAPGPVSGPSGPVADPSGAVAGSPGPVAGSPVADKSGYDFFISYSHVQSAQVAELVKALKEKDGSLNIFYDRSSIPTGSQWIRQISDAIQHSNSVICVLSPQYRDSDACWDEFQCAKVKEFRTKKPVIKTINFLTDADMPLIMAVYSYIDCTEGDVNKLKDAVGSLF